MIDIEREAAEFEARWRLDTLARNELIALGHRIRDEAAAAQKEKDAKIAETMPARGTEDANIFANIYHFQVEMNQRTAAAIRGE